MNIYWQLAWAYLKIGIFGFGGGYAMLSLVEAAVVEPGWISEQMFTDIVAISQVTPGPIGINSATYIGYTAPGHVMPEFSGVYWGLLGACVATLAAAAILLMNEANFCPSGERSQLIASVAICAVSFCLVFFRFPWRGKKIKIHPISVMVLAGLAGYLIYGL